MAFGSTTTPALTSSSWTYGVARVRLPVPWSRPSLCAVAVVCLTHRLRAVWMCCASTGPGGVTVRCDWSRLLISGTPPPLRSRAALVYTPTGLYLFGGNLQSAAPEYNEVLAFSAARASKAAACSDPCCPSPSPSQIQDRNMHRLQLSPDCTVASWSVPTVFVCDGGIEPQVRPGRCESVLRSTESSRVLSRCLFRGPIGTGPCWCN